MRVLIKNGHLVDAKTGRNGIFDIIIENGKIAEIGNDFEVTPSCDLIDASGMYVVPGLVDAHCHLRDPGFEYKEDIESGTRSAAKGGFTSIACMPNTSPVADNEAVIKYIINKAKQDGVVNVYPIGAITKGQKGEELAEIGELKFAGAVAVSVDLIRSAKKRGVKVTCETCPHYFSLTEEACKDFNTLAKVNPPLRTEKDVKAIIKGLKDDTIDIIATDHAPHHSDEKNVEFSLAANGLVGFETAVPLAITHLVKPGFLTMEKLVEKMCVNPSEILSLNKGVLDVGRTADITIIDINEKTKVDIKKFSSKSKNSPYHGYELYGSVNYTIVEGNIIVREKVLL